MNITIITYQRFLHPVCCWQYEFWPHRLLYILKHWICWDISLEFSHVLWLWKVENNDLEDFLIFYTAHVKIYHLSIRYSVANDQMFFLIFMQNLFRFILRMHLSAFINLFKMANKARWWTFTVWYIPSYFHSVHYFWKILKITLVI